MGQFEIRQFQDVLSSVMHLPSMSPEHSYSIDTRARIQCSVKVWFICVAY